MAREKTTRKGTLMTLVAVLFAAVLITFPFAFDLTWALPRADADRTLTYSTGKLTWDAAAAVDANGVIKLSMFSSDYDNISTADGANIVAPGTGKTTHIRLLNTVGGSIRYTAVLYRLHETDVPLFAGLSGEDAAVTAYALPEGVTAQQVAGAVGGTVDGNAVKTVDIDWRWDYSVDDSDDRQDTSAGNRSSENEVAYGLYIVVEDSNYNGGEGGHIVPSKTGDSFRVLLWIVLAAVALGVMLLLVFWDRRDRRKHEK